MTKTFRWASGSVRGWWEEPNYSTGCTSRCTRSRAFFDERFDYGAIGTVSNVASRLCDEAKPGQILISPRVLMAVEKDIAVESVGDFVLKGIRRPLTAYNVLEPTKQVDVRYWG